MKLKYLIYTITLTSLTACSDFLETQVTKQIHPQGCQCITGDAYWRGLSPTREYQISSLFGNTCR